MEMRGKHGNIYILKNTCKESENLQEKSCQCSYILEVKHCVKRKFKNDIYCYDHGVKFILKRKFSEV